MSEAVVEAESVAAIEALARDLERLQSLRAVKEVQRRYAHYLQFGLWDEAAGLFADNAQLLWGEEAVVGRGAIAAWLTRRGGGHPGLPPGALHTELIDEPLVNLSVDGRSAKGRWMMMAFLGDGQGAASIEGGVYENEYRCVGRDWKLSVVRFHPQFSGAYETGWANIDGADLPIIPYHFSVDDTGMPVPPPDSAPPPSGLTLEVLRHRVAVLNAEDAVRNLQAIYGYYVDRCLWNDVADLFCDDCAVEISGAGIFAGRQGVRRAMERMGPTSLSRGRLNDRLQFDTIVEVLPGACEAFSRGIELGMVGDTAKGIARWEIDVFRNRFVCDGGVWKFKELRLYRVLTADYSEGWGNGGIGAPERRIPAFLSQTGEAPLTGPVAPDPALIEDAPLAIVRQRLARSSAYDGVENVSAAYGYYLDDFQWTAMSGIFAEQGNKHSPFAGYYLGRDRIAKAATAMWGTSRSARAGISYHWRTQPVIHVAEDGRSANLRTRLFQPRTSKTPEGPGGPGMFLGASFHGGMYPNDQAVLEDGVWRLWSLTIDEHYFTSSDWKGGWAGVKDAEPDSRPPASPLVQRFPPDILMTELGRRAQHFRGGTGETIEWPGILPMWFHYRNPVSGRVPERYWPDCVPCVLRPQASMTRHGYLMPPTGPEIDGVERDIP